MKLNKLEPILDNPKYEGFAFESRESVRGTHSLTDDFMPDNVLSEGRKWTAPTLRAHWSPRKVVGRVRAFNDYPCANLLIPVFSRRAVDALRDLLEPNGELLPVVSDVGEYFAYNTTKVADILDHERSEIQWPKSGNVVPLRVSRYECVEARMLGLSIFRLVEHPASTFVTQVFVDRVKEHDLKGFNFKELWSSGVEQPAVSSRVESRNGEDDNLKANTLVIMFTLAKAKPSKSETAALAKIMDEIDALLYHPDDHDTARYYGSLEGDDCHEGTSRLFLSCPDANRLFEHIQTWLSKVKWKGNIGVLKRYGDLYDTDCDEQLIEI